MTRWRIYIDRLIVLAVILAAWQVGSVLVGPYWLSSPLAVAARFTAQILNGELIVHGGYTVEEALIGTVIGGVPAVLLPFLLRRHPVIVAILDPFMVGGYGAPKLAFAPLFILWFGIGIESKIALVASVVFFIVYFTTLSGVRALDPQLVQMAQIVGASERQVARHIVFPGGGAAYLRRLSHRGALRHRRRGHRRADLVQSRARLSGADRRDELRHHLGVRRDPRRHPHRPCRQLAAQRRRAGAAALAAAAGGRARHRDLSMSDTPLLEIRSLGKRFPARHGREPSPWVIQDLSFSVGAGEFLTIVGPSGAGKSTLLNMIAQIDTASAGEIVFDGETRDFARCADVAARLRPAHRLCHPGRQPAAVAHDHRQRAVSARGAGAPERRRPARRPTCSSAPSGSPASSAIIRTNCPAACASARRSSARWSTIRRSS